MVAAVDVVVVVVLVVAVVVVVVAVVVVVVAKSLHLKPPTTQNLKVMRPSGRKLKTLNP